MFHFDNSYRNLPEIFYTRINPVPVRGPSLVIYNEQLAKEINLSEICPADKAQIFSGNLIPNGAEPLAQAYAGHQFGYFTLLGDGRAHLLGEHITADGKRLDIQLKGSGQTPYSRRGDGRAAIGPMLREYIISEAVHFLNIPTTRSLAVVLTGEKIIRETELPGAILTRIANSHIRIGTFEYAAAQGNNDLLRSLLNYTVNRHYPHLNESDSKALDFIQAVMKKQIDLIVDWMRVGFIHGVMNTDNAAISGETIDYGPCAFMDTYHPQTVFSSIDHAGRYAYANQPTILRWNLARLTETLLPLISEDPAKAMDAAETVLTGFADEYHQKWRAMMLRKLGLTYEHRDDETILRDLLNWMENNKADFTNTFRYLTAMARSAIPQNEDGEWKGWLDRWQKRLTHQPGDPSFAQHIMRQSNPAVIPRNHDVERALKEAESGNEAPLMQLLNVLKDPYTERPALAPYQTPPDPSERIYQTFCGT